MLRELLENREQSLLISTARQVSAAERVQREEQMSEDLQSALQLALEQRAHAVTCRYTPLPAVTYAQAVACRCMPPRKLQFALEKAGRYVLLLYALVASGQSELADVICRTPASSAT